MCRNGTVQHQPASSSAATGSRCGRKRSPAAAAASTAAPSAANRGAESGGGQRPEPGCGRSRPRRSTSANGIAIPPTPASCPRANVVQPTPSSNPAATNADLRVGRSVSERAPPNARYSLARFQPSSSAANSAEHAP